MTKPITQKQQEILKLLYKYRFLNRIQIQTFLNHKYHKRINDWLNDLTKKEYTGRIYSNTLGENTKPAIYYIEKNGIGFLKTEFNFSSEHLQRLYRDNERSEDFIDQCILMGDIFLELRDVSIQSRKKESKGEITYIASTAIDLANHDHPLNFLTELKPDLLIKKVSRKKTVKKTKTIYYLLTVFSPTLPKYSVRKRIKDFISFYNSGEWEDNGKNPFPVVMIICPTLSTLIYSKRFARRLLAEEDNMKNFVIHFTTFDQIKKHGVDDHIWEPVN